eukprot:jgi/Mesvir1/4596/Mv15824-RA.1
MGKRERENPCFICNHYHKYEEGEICGVCGHRPLAADEKGERFSALPTEIIPNFLFLGSYDTASRAELLRDMGIKHIVNVVPACHNLFRNTFTYHTYPPEGTTLPFEPVLASLESIQRAGEVVLLHCMSGVTRAPALAMAYLMKHQRMRLADAYEFVKSLRKGINITPDAARQLQAFERAVFGEGTDVTPGTPGAEASAGQLGPSFLPPGSSGAFTFAAGVASVSPAAGQPVGPENHACGVHGNMDMQ